MIKFIRKKNTLGEVGLYVPLFIAQVMGYMEECNFYCLKKEKVFRLKNKKSYELIKIPILEEFYGPRTNVIVDGMGWWEDKFYKTKINCLDGVLEIENNHSKPTEYTIK